MMLSHDSFLLVVLMICNSAFLCVFLQCFSHPFTAHLHTRSNHCLFTCSSSHTNTAVLRQHLVQVIFWMNRGMNEWRKVIFLRMDLFISYSVIRCPQCHGLYILLHIRCSKNSKLNSTFCWIVIRWIIKQPTHFISDSFNGTIKVTL